MSDRCITGKKMFASQQMAEDVLIELWSKNEYVSGHAPIAVYKCDDCGQFHFTSRGPMNEKLSEAISSGKIKLHREANKWSDKWKRK
jgi:hypothetical protein